MIGTRRRNRGFLVLALALVVVGAGCQSSQSESRRTGAASTSTTTTTTSTTTTTTTLAPTTTTTGGPTPTGPLGNPWPLIGPAPAGHHAILAMGDSLMGQTLVTLPAVLAAHGFDAVVYDAHVNASGLLDPMNGISARELLAQQLAAHPDVDTVLFEWAGVCASACGPGKLTYGSPEFFTAWEAAARELVGDAVHRGLRVVWAISPPPPPDVNNEGFAEKTRIATLLTWYERGYAADFGVTVADWWQALSDTSGQWQEALWYDDALHTVRLSDLVHITEDGSTRTSTWTVAALAKLYAQ